MRKQVKRQDSKQVRGYEMTNPVPEIPDEGISTSGTIRERILSMPDDEDFAIIIPIGGDMNGCE